MEESTFEPQEVDLRAYWETLKKRRFTIIVSLIVVLTLVSLLTLMQKPRYEASTKLLARGSNANHSDLLSSTIPALGAFADQRDVQTQVEIIQSRPLLEEAARRSGMAVSEGEKIPVKVEGGKDTNVITVTASSTDPSQARDLANNVAQVYVDENLQENRSSAHAGRVFLEEQQERYRKDLQEAARNLRNYEESTGAVSLDAATEAEVRALTEAEAARTAADTEQRAATARANQIRQVLRGTNDTIVSSSSIQRNPTIQKLQDEIADLSVEKAGLLKSYGPDSRKVQAIDAQIAQAETRQKEVMGDILASKTVSVNPVHQTLLGQMVDSEGEALSAAARIAGMNRAIREQTERLQRLPRQKYRLAQLEREVQVAEKTYLVLQERYQSLRIAEESTLANVRVLESAITPRHPVSPKVKLNLILGTLVGLMLGVGLAALLEALDDSIRTTEDVERELGVPLLGMVHNIVDPEQRSLRQAGTLSTVAEAFRMVRSNVKFLSVDRDLKTVLVTSATKGEGKSTTASNLAIALAQDGRKVVLIDGDLRRPSVHKQFGIPNVAGLTNAIAGGAALKDVSTRVDIENLTIVTAGPIPPNPAELLDSDRFGHLLAELAASHDTVVLDGPPVLGVADASVLGGRVDGVVVLAASGHVERKAVQRAIQMLQQARAHVLGVVLNKVDARSSQYGYYYYYGQDGNGNETGQKPSGKIKSLAGKGRD